MQASIESTVTGIQFHLRCQDPSAASILGDPSMRLLLKGLKKESPQATINVSLPLVRKITSRLRGGCFEHYR